MKSYSVKEIASMLGTSEETVRRWIRDKKLNAVQSSRKGGNSVSENDLYKFLQKSPKYANTIVATPGLNPIVGISLLTASLVGSIIADKKITEDELKRARILPEDMIAFLEKAKEEHEVTIKEKNDTINTLKQDISDEEEQIRKLDDMIEQVKNIKKEGSE